MKRLFELSGAISSLKLLCCNGFRLSHIECSMSPAKDKRNKIKTQNLQLERFEPLLCH